MDETLSPYQPTWRDRVANLLMGTDYERPSPSRRALVEGLVGSSGLGNTGMSVSDLTPVGGVLGLQEDAQHGNKFGMALNAASLIPGAAVAKAVEKVGPAAERLASGLASSFDVPAYHATRAGFDTFSDPANMYRGLTFFAPNEKAASKGMSGGARDLAELVDSGVIPQDTRAEKVIPVQLRSQDIRGLSWTPEERAWYANSPDKFVGDEGFNKVIGSMPKGSDISWTQAYGYDDALVNKLLDAGVPATEIGKTLEYTKKPMPTYTYEQAQKTGRDIYGKLIPGYNTWGDADRASAKRVLDSGMAGFLVHDEGGVSIAHALPHDPERLRYVTPQPAQASTDW